MMMIDDGYSICVFPPLPLFHTSSKKKHSSFPNGKVRPDLISNPGPSKLLPWLGGEGSSHWAPFAGPAMSERLVAWRSKPSDAVVQTIRGLSSRMIYLVQRPGPTSFVLQEEGSEQKTKVLVGGRVTCSCCRQNEGQACAHTLFVMIKVLGVPPSNPLVWQGSLLDRELEEVIQCGNRLGGGKQHQKGKRALAGSVGEGKGSQNYDNKNDKCVSALPSQYQG